MDISGKLNGLDLFSGIGGISWALRDYVRPIAYCEIDPYCQGVLLSLMEKQCINKAPIWDDIRAFNPEPFREEIDIIYGGFPCQDISVAGHGKGLAGERSGLFFEIMRLAKEIKPAFLFLENVPAITTRGGLQVVREIASLGYDCRWCVISAASIGALHRRERWFLLAHSPSTSAIGHTERKEETHSMFGICCNDSNANSVASEQADISTYSKCRSKKTRGNDSTEYWPFESRNDWQKTVCEMGKCSDGISYNMDRLRALGNGVVSQQVKKAFKILMGIE